jgi:hypothetical protein
MLVTVDNWAVSQTIDFRAKQVTLKVFDVITRVPHPELNGLQIPYLTFKGLQIAKKVLDEVCVEANVLIERA